MERKKWCNCTTTWGRDMGRGIIEEEIYGDPCPKCGYNRWYRKEDGEMGRRWKILKPISGKLVGEAGACQEELGDFIKQFGFNAELGNEAIQWIENHKQGWMEWLEEAKFLELVKESPMIRVRTEYWANKYQGEAVEDYQHPTRYEADQGKKRSGERLDCLHVVGDVRTIPRDQKKPLDVEVGEGDVTLTLSRDLAISIWHRLNCAESRSFESYEYGGSDVPPSPLNTYMAWCAFNEMFDPRKENAE